MTDMKVRKIDVSQKLIEMRDGEPVYWEVEYDPKNIMIRTQGEVPDQVTVRQNAYHVQQIFKSGTFNTEKEYVAVRMDDRGIFNDLIQVSNDTFAAKMAKAREDGFWDGEQKGFQKGEKRMLKAFKELPWYKRLLGKF